MSRWRRTTICQHPDGDNSTGFTAPEIELKPGHTLRVEGITDGHDPAALDYIQKLPAAAAALTSTSNTSGAVAQPR